MLHRVVVTAAVVVWLSGCKGSSSTQAGGAAEPDKAVRAFAEAVERGDVAAMQRLMISPDRIRKALDCPGAENLANDVTQAHQALRELAKAKDALGGMGLSLESMTEDAHATVARGDSFHGCTAREGFESRSYQVVLRAASLNESGDEKQEVIRLDGVWWMLPAS